MAKMEFIKCYVEWTIVDVLNKKVIEVKFN